MAPLRSRIEDRVGAIILRTGSMVICSIEFETKFDGDEVSLSFYTISTQNIMSRTIFERDWKY